MKVGSAAVPVTNNPASTQSRIRARRRSASAAAPAFSKVRLIARRGIDNVAAASRAGLSTHYVGARPDIWFDVFVENERECGPSAATGLDDDFEMRSSLSSTTSHASVAQIGSRSNQLRRSKRIFRRVMGNRWPQESRLS